MQLKTVDGKLTLGSVYKLFVIGWLVSWSAFVGFVLLVLVLITIATGQMTVNGEIVQGTGPALLAMAPIVVLFPVVVILQAFMFGAFLTFGIWLYRLKRPLHIIAS